MHDTMIVQISHRGEDRTDEVSCIGLVIAALTTDAVEQLSPQSKLCDEVYCNITETLSVGGPGPSSRGSHTIVHGLEVINQSQNVLMPHGNSLQHRNLIPNLSLYHATHQPPLDVHVDLKSPRFRFRGKYHVLSPSH